VSSLKVSARMSAGMVSLACQYEPRGRRPRSGSVDGPAVPTKP
jgi:hypothetical protein